MNKKYMFGFLFFALVAFATAGYLVNSFVIQTDVYEPFEVQYFIIGDGGNYESGLCSEVAEEDWITMQDNAVIDVGGLYAGESRKVCTKITNLGEGDVDYTFSGEVVSGLGNLAECQAAFGNPSVSGTVEGLDTIFDGAVINVAGDATPVEDCEVTLSITRG